MFVVMPKIRPYVEMLPLDNLLRHETTDDSGVLGRESKKVYEADNSMSALSCESMEVCICCWLFNLHSMIPGPRISPSAKGLAPPSSFNSSFK